jgi:hypothetical protein
MYMVTLNVFVSGFTGDYAFLNTRYTNPEPGFTGVGVYYQSGEGENALYLYQDFDNENNTVWYIGDNNVYAYSEDLNVENPWEVTSWILEEGVTGTNVTIVEYFTECISLSSFFISGASFLQNFNVQWNNLSWEEGSFAPNINAEQYYQVWGATWYPQGVGNVVNYLFLVGPKLSGGPVFEIYNTTFTTEYVISGDGPILTSEPFVGPGIACPNCVSWPGEPNILFTLAPPEPEPILSNTPVINFEQVANLHGGVANFLRLRYLGYF